MGNRSTDFQQYQLKVFVIQLKEAQTRLTIKEHEYRAKMAQVVRKLATRNRANSDAFKEYREQHP